MTVLINRRKHLLVIGTALLATACVSTSLEPGTDHPANAKADTAPPTARDNILASAPATEQANTVPAAHTHDHAAPMADTYTCTMHPQVVKNAPGKCPICGMNLVKKESAAPEKAAP
jgi:septal ring-binding cell division protein DamX